MKFETDKDVRTRLTLNAVPEALGLSAATMQQNFIKGYLFGI
jgi:hypothetical protein